MHLSKSVCKFVCIFNANKYVSQVLSAPKSQQKNEAPITVSISIRQTRLLTTLGYSVDSSAWLESGQVKPKYTNSKGITSRIINSRIFKIQIHFGEYEQSLRSRPTVEELKEQLNIAISLGDDLKPQEVAQDAPIKTIFQFLDEFIKEQSLLNQWAHSTVQAWHTFSNHMESFGYCVEFSDFNENGINRFIMHLRKVRKLEEKTVQKQY